MSDPYTARPDGKDTTGKNFGSQDLACKAKDMVRDVKAKASDLTDGVTRAAKDNASQLGDAAVDMANTAKDNVEAAVTERKSLGADYIGSIAQATGRAAHEFEAELPRPHTTSVRRPNRSRVSPTPSASAMCVSW
jgi:hypothetical protein